jgi:type VI secretion system protein ImpE
MSAEDSLREGRLGEALSQLQEQVRKAPAEPKYRVFLFQLYAVLGEWDRALTQLNVAGDLDAGTLAMVQTYREALRCEVLREQVFAGKRTPLIFGDPESWVAWLLEALRLTADGQYAQAQPLRDQAFEHAPTTTGQIDGAEFSWVSDADMRLGPVLEAVINGHYYWVPWHRIRTVCLEKPEDLRDVVWMPAQFTWANGGETVGLIPTRYPGSQKSDDPLLKLARRTEWTEPEPNLFLGLGQRQLATDTGEYSLMDVRRIDLNSSDGGTDT